MTNSSLPAYSSSTPTAQIQGITEIRQKTIAALIARGFSVKYVSKKLKISESRIYHLFSEKNSIVTDEIYRILNDAFESSDYRLINLYDKALQKLDAMLSSPDEEKQCRAIDRIIKMFFARFSKNGVTIQQYFGIESQDKKKIPPGGIDEYILQRKKDRRVPEHDDDEKDEEEKECSDSVSDTSTTDASATNDSSRDNSLLDTSTPEYKEFLESVK